METAIIFVLFLVALQVKHLFVDFYIQPPYMFMNKGDLSHAGGYAHAGLHGLGTFLVFSIFGIKVAIVVAILDFICHYAIDYWKVNVTRKNGWTPDTPRFWHMLGVDQFLHQLTYIFLILIAFTL